MSELFTSLEGLPIEEAFQILRSLIKEGHRELFLEWMKNPKGREWIEANALKILGIGYV